MTTLDIDLSVFNISDKEKTIFQLLLESGELSASEIADGCNIKRSTVYLNLDNLKKGGLIIEFISARKKYFKVAPSSSIQQIIQNKVNNLNKLKKTLPELIHRNSKKNSSKNLPVTVYEGKEGVNKVIQEISMSTDDAYLLGSAKSFYKIVGSESWKISYSKKRRVKTLPTDYLITDWATPTIREYYQNSELFTKRRFLPANLDLNCGLIIYGNKVVIGVLTKNAQIVILEEPTLATLFKTLFQFYWQDLEGKNIPPQLIS